MCEEARAEGTRLGQRDDEALVSLAGAGCREAFDALARRYRAGAFLVAQSIVGNTAQAEDVAQEAILVAFHALPSLADPARFGPWLAAITRRRARRVAQQEGRFVPLEPAHLDRPPTAAVRVRDDLAEALAELGGEYQAVLRLRYWEEWPVARIATFLSLPSTTIKWRLHHARELLRRRLGRQSPRPT